MSSTGNPRKELEEYRRAIMVAGNGLSRYDYIGNIDRFRHGSSGDLLKESALLNLFGHTIPGKMHVTTALYSDTLGIRQYAGMTFAPGQPANLISQGQLEFNTWVKPNTTPIEGDAQPFFDLVDLIFDGDIVAAGFFLNSIASLVQKPGTKWAYMVLLIGAQGIGKSMLVEMVAELVGRQNTAFPTLDVFKGQFTGWMLKAYVIIFHELEKMGREGATRLKHWITATTLQINAKNVPEFNIQNYTNILACSNHDDVASLDHDDRRMFSWISHAEKQPQDFYSNLYAWFFEGDGLGIVLHHLLQRDLSGFNPKMAPPQTAGRDRLIANSQSEAENFLSDALESVSPPFVTDLCTASDVLRFLRVQQIRCTDAEVRRFLRQCGAHSLGQCRVNGARPNLWAVRNIEQWQAATHDDIAEGYVNVFDQYAVVAARAAQDAKSALMPVRKPRKSAAKTDDKPSL